jgi:uncharacterized protein (TIGR03545 family)
MKRFSYLIPRVMILCLLACAIWLAKDGLVRRALISYGQQFTAAKVEIDQLQTNLNQQRVLIKGLKIADPRNPMSNLLQADIAYLKLDPRQLCNKKFVISEGQINGLMVNAPRTTSGALHPSLPVANAGSTRREFPENEPSASNEHSRQVSQAWLNRLDPNAKHTIPPIESESLMGTMKDRWTKRITNNQTLQQEIQPKLRSLSAEFSNSAKFPNPLRDRTKYESSIAEIEQLQTRTVELRQDVEAQLDQLRSEVTEIEVAVNRDCQHIRQRQPKNQFDEKLVSELLLGEENRQLIDEILIWLVWFRESLPDSDKYQLQRPNQGTTFAFTNIAPTPDFLIHKMELEGNGWFAKQHVNFIGTAFNVSLQPQLLSEPTRIELRALGRSNVLIDCLVDRTNGKQLDQLTIQFPDLNFSQRQAGDERSMMVSFGGNRKANSNIRLEVDGTRITGAVKLNYSQVSLHVDSLNEMLGGDEIRLRINQGLNQINRFETTFWVDGTLDNYTVSMESDLGKQLAKVVDSAVIDRIEQQNQQLISALVQKKEQLLLQYRNEFEPALNGMLEQLSNDVTRVCGLKENLQSNSESGWRRLR